MTIAEPSTETVATMTEVPTEVPTADVLHEDTAAEDTAADAMNEDIASETVSHGPPMDDALPAVDPEQIPTIIEALLFVADGPVEESALAKVLGVTRRQLDAPLQVLGAALRERGVRLQRGPDGVQLVTAPAASRHIEQFLGLEAARKLSPAALETLAIIAYRQPVTRATLEAIRGVSCDGPVDTLRARGLIDVAGRADSPGRPTLFATTQKFLEHFGLERAEDLPELPPEVAELAEALPERAGQFTFPDPLPEHAEQLALDVLAASDAPLDSDTADEPAPEAFPELIDDRAEPQTEPDPIPSETVSSPSGG